MPLPLVPPNENYAYVIEYRALDRCFVPACSLKSNDVSGFARELSPEGEPGHYAAFGDPKTEMFYRRAQQLRKGEELSFELPALDAESELEADFSAVDRGAFEATVLFEEIRPAAPAISLGSLHVRGESKPTDETIRAAYGDPTRYFQHLRAKIPDRKGRRIRVIIRATGGPVSVGSPFVMKRVERPARQAIFVVFDAVPYPIFERLFYEGTGEKNTAWLEKEVKSRGLYFSHGQVPGMNTATYGRRFMRNDMYRTDGEQALTGQGIEESPPEVVPTFVARLAEQGFRTEILSDNFTLMPFTTRLGNDGGYNNEFIDHPQKITALFQAWLADHPNDDAFVILWSARTHDTITNSRPGPSLKFPEGLPLARLNVTRLTGLWWNALESTERVEPAFQAARKLSPGAQRLWTFSTDHGQAMSAWLGGQSYRLPLHGATTGASHGVFGSVDETRTPFVAIYDGSLAPQHGAPKRFDDPISQVNEWRLVEDAFGITLGLPDTSQYDSVLLHPERAAAAWDDGALFSVGNGGALRATVPDWAYRSFTANLHADKIWKCSLSQQLALRGSPRFQGSFLAEELYEPAHDPMEFTNVASAHPDRVAEMRRRTSDFLAAHSDAPGHPRYVQTLRFPEIVYVTITAPHPFRARVDGVDVPMSSPRMVAVHGKRVEIIDEVDLTSVIEVHGPSVSAPLALTCANGLPVDALTPDRSRLNFAVARTNCIEGPAGERDVKKGTILFSFEKRKTSQSGSSLLPTFQGSNGAGSAQQNAIMDGMKRWGYVRDMDKKN